MDRLEKIRAKRASLDAEALAEEQRKEFNINYYTNAIRGLSKRVADMMAVADEMVKNRLHFGDKKRSVGDWFETNSLDHNLGFVFKYVENKGTLFNYRLSVIGIGIKGKGGCSYDNNFIVGRNCEIISSPVDFIGCWSNNDPFEDYCKKANRFLNEFNEFEGEFYEYVDSL